MTYTFVDGIVLLILVLSTLLAWSRGFVREGLSILGWVVAVLLAMKFFYLAIPFLEGLPVVSKYFANSCELLAVAAFVVTFIISMVVMALLTPFLSGLIQNSAFSAFDSGLGAFFGFARGVVIVLLALLIYDSFVSASTPIPQIDNSQSYAIFADPKATLENNLPDQDAAPSWLLEQFNKITASCTTNG